MPYDLSGYDPGSVGSGSPYAGSGFTNFDQFMQPENVNWGAQQPGYSIQGDDYSVNPNLDNWMINAGGRQGFPVEAPPPEVVQPYVPPPERIYTGRPNTPYYPQPDPGPQTPSQPELDPNSGGITTSGGDPIYSPEQTGDPAGPNTWQPDRPYMGPPRPTPSLPAPETPKVGDPLPTPAPRPNGPRGRSSVSGFPSLDRLSTSAW